MKRAAQLAAKWSVHPDNEIWYGAPTFKQAKRVFWPRLKRAIPAHWVEHKNENECHLTTVAGHTLRIVGLDLYDNLRGSGLFFFIGDEWADVPPQAWIEVVSPMLSTAHGHSLKIGTPKGFDHFYDEYVLGQEGGEVDHKSWHYTTLQGGNVPQAELERAKRILDARTYEQEYEAGFVTYSGRVIYAFDRKLHVQDCPYKPELPVYIGMDFNLNPMSATVWQEYGGAIRQIDEIILPTSNTDDMSDVIAHRYGRPSFTPGEIEVGHITVYPDPAGAQSRTSAQGRTDISILRGRGFSVMAMSKAPLIRDRITETNARFRNAAGDIRAYVDPCCLQSIKAYEKQTYVEGTNDPDKKSGFDHIVDATGYFIYGRFAYKPARFNQGFNIGR
ncbi:hypothetical protein [Acidocella aminolytica]|uniref:Terminase n=1 Tax=Acidocella aminolytica 101 = DSM 11237 TaxID=1120923 RepID=A0A0D6PG00_9PROT|nr:hypothetical protein [Acidocella aminolytica]GAN79789.1 hypothetical protein Aam_030_022 [Acidocella aminolytica 101 = DSM 11237]GBQ32055.1 phage terminase protein [Acidocella aminolytica 101 = DSM 11237]